MGAKVAELECDGNYCGFSQNNIDLNLPVAATERENFAKFKLGTCANWFTNKISHQKQKKELSEARGETRVSLGHQQSLVVVSV